VKLEELQAAAGRLGRHPQDHGWREFFRLVEYGLAQSCSVLGDVLLRCAERQPAHSPSHLINLLGISLKRVGPDAFAAFGRSSSPRARLAVLEEMLHAHGSDVVRIVTERRNSFTGARRFLVPQVILGAYFAHHEGDEVTFADFGTGLGIMPRQLNSERLYRRFGADLPWPGGVPRFRRIPLRRLMGVDCGPLPDLEWVQACYGASVYYAGLFEELTYTLAALGDDGSPVEYRELDLLDADALARFLREQPVHAGNLSYVLYEIDPDRRRQVLDTLRAGLREPGLIISTEPRAELTAQGCDVLVYSHDRTTPYRLCTISDGHFKGKVTASQDYAEFIRRYPLAFD
jgi:hypothetical protein